MTDQQTETPMSDHVARFWHLLRTEYVFVAVNIRREHDEGNPPHWDTSQFGNDVAKAIVAAGIEAEQLRALLQDVLRFMERGSFNRPLQNRMRTELGIPTVRSEESD